MKTLKHKTYEALGFVEALIAIMVVGISSVVLMQIAVDTMQNTIQNEVIDNMTQIAVETAELVQEIADKERDTGEDLFPGVEVQAGCFILDYVDGEYVFRSSGGIFERYEKTDREEYKNEGIIDDSDLFRVVCLESTPQESVTFIVASIIVGQVNSDGTITKGNLVKDYEYLTTIRL